MPVLNVRVARRSFAAPAATRSARTTGGGRPQPQLRIHCFVGLQRDARGGLPRHREHVGVGGAVPGRARGAVAIAARARCASRARERDHGRPATEPRRAGARPTPPAAARAVPLGETAAADVGGGASSSSTRRARAIIISHGRRRPRAAPPVCGNIAPAQNLSVPSTTARFGSSSPRPRTKSLFSSAPARLYSTTTGVVFPIVVFGCR